MSTGFIGLPITDPTVATMINLYYRKVADHLVEVRMFPNSTDLIVPSTLTQIATMPEGFRPAIVTFECDICGRIKVGSTLDSRFTIDTTGAVYIVNYSAQETINSPFNSYLYSI